MKTYFFSKFFSKNLTAFFFLFLSNPRCIFTRSFAWEKSFSNLFFSHAKAMTGAMTGFKVMLTQINKRKNLAYYNLCFISKTPRQVKIKES